MAIKPIAAESLIRLLVHFRSSSQLSALARDSIRRASKSGHVLPQKSFILHLDSNDGPTVDADDEIHHVIIQPREETLFITWLPPKLVEHELPKLMEHEPPKLVQHESSKLVEHELPKLVEHEPPPVSLTFSRLLVRQLQHR